MELEITAVIKCPDDAFKTRASTVDEIAKQKKALQSYAIFRKAGCCREIVAKIFETTKISQTIS